ncbi:sigma-70 family RNA polymerase sigma factor [Rhodanobacter glycinis]|uniref:Sigma-70 family RNA polymerase sigma factor n=1 Tax=Rhodanobacter glycinis TaxID=582702 RepID=A0A5B9DVI9_9GAMM|nr:sigma-70 family RNA polymerase sigma factor [Rhodanobacter glycinis]QEE23228.1 sigma-70 family RNA polymerase sigma factor [Rhodanobacter glycinis]
MHAKWDQVSIEPPPAPADGARAIAEAFDAFVREQRRPLLHFLRSRTPTEQDAEDVLQESLARLLRYRDSEAPAGWKPLLYRIAANVAHDQRRAATSRHSGDHVTLDDLELATDDRSPEQRADCDQQLARLSEAIMALPPKCQRVYLLKRVYGFSRTQIAERCGISVKMVEKHITTAMALLKQKVGDSFPDTF